MLFCLLLPSVIASVSRLDGSGTRLYWALTLFSFGLNGRKWSIEPWLVKTTKLKKIFQKAFQNNILLLCCKRNDRRLNPTKYFGSVTTYRIISTVYIGLNKDFADF